MSNTLVKPVSHVNNLSIKLRTFCNPSKLAFSESLIWERLKIELSHEELIWLIGENDKDGRQIYYSSLFTLSKLCL